MIFFGLRGVGGRKISQLNPKGFRLSEKDLDFLLETASPGVSDKLRLKMIIKEDEDFRNTFTGDERVFRRVMRFS